MVLSLVGVFARRGGWSRPLPLGAPRPCFYPPFSLLEARAALQAKATRLRRFFSDANGAGGIRSSVCSVAFARRGVCQNAHFGFTFEGASEWLRCKALRMRAQGVY